MLKNEIVPTIEIVIISAFCNVVFWLPRVLLLARLARITD